MTLETTLCSGTFMTTASPGDRRQLVVEHRPAVVEPVLDVPSGDLDFELTRQSFRLACSFATLPRPEPVGRWYKPEGHPLLGHGYHVEQPHREGGVVPRDAVDEDLRVREDVVDLPLVLRPDGGGRADGHSQRVGVLDRVGAGEGLMMNRLDFLSCPMSAGRSAA